MPERIATNNSLRDSLALSEQAYRDFRAGHGSLEEVHYWLADFLGELEQFRLDQPQDAPDVLFLGRYDVYETATALAYSLGRVLDAFEYSERTRARFLLDRTLNKLSFDSRNIKDRELLQKEARLRKRVNELTRQWQNSTINSGTAPKVGTKTEDEGKGEGLQGIEVELRQARTELREVQDDIRQQDPAFAAMRGTAPATVNDAKSLLDKESALLAYCVTEERLIIFIITSQTIQTEHVNTPRSQISELVRLYRQRIEQFATSSRDIILEASSQSIRPTALPKDAELESLTRRLYEILISPASSHIRGKTRLGVIPHGDLHLLPFQALRSERGYLIEQYALWYAPSISLLDLCYQRQRRSRGRLLALGDPDLGNPRLRLPFAAQEVSDIALLFNTTPYIGQHANLAILKQQWEKSDVLHLACHALFDAEQPEFSALLLTPSDENTGRLEVQELFALDRDLPLSLVTLSACQTSLGIGNDLTGLATGFLYAGAPAVIASLWRVDDFSTSELMMRFYRELADHGRGDALREAQLRLLRTPEHVHPYFWAAFKLIGSPLPLESEQIHSASAFNMIHRWTYRSEDGTLSEPVVSGDLLYATWSEALKDEDASSEWEKAARKRAICAVSLADRQLRWKHALSDWGKAFCWCPDIVHVNSASGVCALRSNDGEVVWTHEIGGYFPQSICYDGNRLYLGGRARSVLALQPTTGEVIWEYPLSRPASGGFAIGDGVVFVGCNDHHLYAINAHDGSLLWKQDLGYTEWKDKIAWVSNGYLLTTVDAFEVKTGQRNRDSRLNEEEKVITHNRLSLDRVNKLPRGREIYFKETYLYPDNDLVFATNSQDGIVYLSMFGTSDGSLLRRYRLGGSGFTGFCREGELVVVGAGDGSLNGFSVERAKKE